MIIAKKTYEEDEILQKWWLYIPSNKCEG